MDVIFWREGWKLPIVVALLFIVMGKVLYFFEEDDLREPLEFTEPKDYRELKLHWLSLPPYPEP